jgi:hypothetical protein
MTDAIVDCVDLLQLCEKLQPGSLDLDCAEMMRRESKAVSSQAGKEDLAIGGGMIF